MIAELSGHISSIAGRVFVIDVGGVGYEVIGTSSLLTKLAIGSAARIVIYTDVREDAIRLFGFETKSEKQCFLLLLKVSGVGTKTAGEIVSQVPVAELFRYIGNSDLTALTKLKGVGKKTAERIVVELRERVGEFAEERDRSADKISSPSNVFEEAIAALVALGFPVKEAGRAIDEVKKNQTDARGLETGELVREALRFV